MNDLQKLIVTAGQKVHEDLFGATLTIFGRTIPCSSTKIERDFDLVPGGQSPKTFVKAITFRRELLAVTEFPKKGVRCELKLTADSDTITLQLWSGGPVAGDALYQFMAVDANYNA